MTKPSKTCCAVFALALTLRAIPGKMMMIVHTKSMLHGDAVCFITGVSAVCVRQHTDSKRYTHARVHFCSFTARALDYLALPAVLRQHRFLLGLCKTAIRHIEWLTI